MKSRLVVGIFAVVAVLVLATTPAYAQATRTWVSGVGDDANPCSRTAPCKTFAGAYSKTAVGGEINVLDPGGFGAVTISKSLTISSQSDEAGVLVSGTNGIVVQVPNATDTVILRGLDIEGLGTGLTGVLINVGGNVTIENCSINHYTVDGIGFTPTVAGSQLHVSNTIVRNNGTFPGSGHGINIGPTAAATATLDRVRMDHNVVGLQLTTGTGNVAVTDSIAANNGNAGFSAAASGAVMNVEKSLSAHNATGVACAAGSVVRLGNNSITDNSTAVAGSANCLTFKNNDIDVVVNPAMQPLNPQ
ncbi:MAG TPA: right-handed parallel beta-helix repeat-containing protein [Thermoanaerobaculia bacterium]|nr:right-handed parallel beta-helix repeat-containing protein [Thermoanaerobaculia bacterium]